MRSALSEWYQVDAAARQSLLRDGIIVFDTNSLLTLYRLSFEDRKRVLELLDALKNRVWIPYQTALEFHRNRFEVVREQLEAYEEIAKKVRALRNQVVDSLRAHPVLSQSSIKREISDRLQSLETYLSQQYDELHPEDIRYPSEEDGVLEAVTALFDGRVGKRPTVTPELLSAAADRFERKTPPGYEDAKKPVPERYGDYFLWKETLDHWGTSGESWTGGLILVSEEKKADWWLKDQKSQQILQPRPELVREAADHGLQPFWLVSLRRFYSAGATELGWSNTELGEYTAVDSGDGTELQQTPEGP